MIDKDYTCEDWGEQSEWLQIKVTVKLEELDDTVAVMNMVSNSSMLTHSDEFTSFLGKCLNIVIGIEFLKMLCRHNMDAVIEVLLFTLARHLIVKQFEILEGLICVVAISLLFVVRRFLFVAHIDNVYDEFKKDKEEATKSPDGEKLEEYV